MKSVASLTLLLLWHSVAQPTLPNIDYVGKGYDILYGNPRPSVDQSDEGWQSNVFYQDHSEGRTQNINGVDYVVPEDYEASACGACEVGFQSSDVMTSSMYKEELEVSAKVSGKGWGAKFKASAGYKEVEEKFYSSNSRFIEATAQCTIYCVSVTDNSSPRITENFRSAVRNLPVTYDRIQYLNIISDFGTHYAKRVDLGVRVGSRMEISASSVQQMRETNIDVAAEARAKGLGVSGGGSVGVEKDNEGHAALDSHVSNTKVYQYGGTYIDISGGDDDAQKSNEWYELSKSSPLPLSFELEQLTTLLTTETFPDELNIRNKRLNLLTAMNEYCGELAAQGIVAECADALYDIERHGPFGGPVPDNAEGFSDHANWDALSQPSLSAIEMNFDQNSGALTGIRTSHKYGDGIRRLGWNGRSDSTKFTLNLDQAVGDFLQEQVTSVEVCMFNRTSATSQSVESIGRLTFETNVDRPHPTVFETDTYHYIDEKLTWIEAESHCNDLGGTIAPATSTDISDLALFVHDAAYSRNGEFRFIAEAKTWDEAKAHCEALGDYQLASPSTEYQMTKFREVIRDATGFLDPRSIVWTGAHATGDSDREFAWLDGTLVHNDLWTLSPPRTDVGGYYWTEVQASDDYINVYNWKSCQDLCLRNTNCHSWTWRNQNHATLPYSCRLNQQDRSFLPDLAEVIHISCKAKECRDDSGECVQFRGSSGLWEKDCTEEHPFVCEPLIDDSLLNVWTGGNDMLREGRVFWSDASTTFSFQDNYFTRFPSVGWNSEDRDCLGWDLTDPDRQGEMRQCEERHRFVCRAPAARDYTCHNVDFPSRLGLLFMSGSLSQYSGEVTELQSLTFNGYLETFEEVELLVDDVIDSEANPNGLGAAESEGLSGGAAAGIAFAVVAAAALAGGAAFFFYRRRGSGSGTKKFSTTVSAAPQSAQVGMQPMGLANGGGGNTVEPSVSSYNYNGANYNGGNPVVEPPRSPSHSPSHSHSHAPSVSSYVYAAKPEPSVSANSASRGGGNPLASHTVPTGGNTRPPPPYYNGRPQGGGQSLHPSAGANTAYASHTVRAPSRSAAAPGAGRHTANMSLPVNPTASPGAPGNFMSKTPPMRSAGPPHAIPPMSGGGMLGPAGGRPIPRTPPMGPAGGRPIPRTPPMGPAGGRPIPRTPPMGPAGGRPIPRTPPMGPAGGRPIPSAPPMGPRAY